MLCLSLHTMRPDCRVWSEGGMAQQQHLSALSGLPRWRLLRPPRPPTAATSSGTWRHKRGEAACSHNTAPHYEACHASSSEPPPQTHLTSTRDATRSGGISGRICARAPILAVHGLDAGSRFCRTFFFASFARQVIGCIAHACTAKI